jgi:hypothetical protein
MRLLLASAALAVLLGVAGCLQGPGLPAAPPRERGMLAAPMPVVDIADFMADYHEFVTAHPIRYGDYPDHEGARQALSRQMAESGLQVWRQNFTANGFEMANIIGIQWGLQRSQVVVVGSHFDTIHDDCAYGPALAAPPPVGSCAGHLASQGAYDDGSGTALTAYMAKLFGHLQATSTVLYAEFDGEEEGLLGATELESSLIDGTSPLGNVTLRAMIDVDMAGLNWPGVATPLHVHHNSDALQHVIDQARTALGVPDDMMWYSDVAQDRAQSDFAPFRSDGPTVYLDADFERLGAPGPAPNDAHTPDGGVYPFWHFVDTWESMTAMAGGPQNLAAGFAVVAKIEVAALHAAAFEPAFELENPQ